MNQAVIAKFIVIEPNPGKLNLKAYTKPYRH